MIKISKTKFAPAEREDKSTVLQQKSRIESSGFLGKVMASTPFMILILNDKRQIVYSNQMIMKYLGYDTIEDMAGYRPGEVFSCIHADTEPGGCGTSENCRYCGAIQAVIESNKLNQLVVSDAVLNLELDGKLTAMNFEISSKPFTWKEERFFVVTLQNIAEKKRKEQLERTFFHDITNKVGNLSMFLDVFKEKYVTEEHDEIFMLVKQGVQETLEDIDYQKKLQQAENGNLVTASDRITANEIVRTVGGEYRSLAKAYDIQIDSGLLKEDLEFVSDRILIKRVIGNMVKNAIEGSKSGEMVRISCFPEQDNIVFSVSNPSFIPKDIQMQLFNRSFSTKGEGRGIGTYSIKLFTEQYLRGNVSFVSDQEQGTTFMVRIPVSGS